MEITLQKINQSHPPFERSILVRKSIENVGKKNYWISTLVGLNGAFTIHNFDVISTCPYLKWIMALNLEKLIHLTLARRVPCTIEQPDQILSCKTKVDAKLYEYINVNLLSIVYINGIISVVSKEIFIGSSFFLP